MSGLLVLVASCLLLWQWKIEPWKLIGVSILAGIVATAASIGVMFLWNLVRYKTLDDPPRTLSYRKQKKITEHLKPYGQGRSPQVSIYVCEDVKDGQDFAESIRKALVEARWHVSLGSADCRAHSVGVWILGSWTNIPADWPPMNKALQEALAKAGIKSQFADQEKGKEYRWLCLIVGQHSN